METAQREGELDVETHEAQAMESQPLTFVRALEGPGTQQTLQGPWCDVYEDQQDAWIPPQHSHRHAG